MFPIGISDHQIIHVFQIDQKDSASHGEVIRRKFCGSVGRPKRHPSYPLHNVRGAYSDLRIRSSSVTSQGINHRAVRQCNHEIIGSSDLNDWNYLC